MDFDFRRIVALEQDIRHAYAEMKNLIQAEEKVRVNSKRFSREFLFVFF